jgi:integrase
LIHAARQLPSPKGLAGQTYATLFGLLTVTGMRISESLAIHDDDVDLVDGVLTIRQTKFRKSRLVPIHLSTQQRLREYARRREQAHARATFRSFFVSDEGQPLAIGVVERTFIKLSRQIGLRGRADSHGPRLHDFRHRFAVQTLLDWYRRGVDVERHMPRLATYLGHANTTHTYWYVTATPQLLRLAAERADDSRGGLLS